MTSNRNHLLKTSFLFAGTLALCAPVHAQNTPEISPTLKKMLGALPLADAKEELQDMLGQLKQTSCVGGLKGLAGNGSTSNFHDVWLRAACRQQLHCLHTITPYFLQQIKRLC